MAVSVFKQTYKPKPRLAIEHRPVWRYNPPSPYQKNIVCAIQTFLEANKNCSRQFVYDTLRQRWGLEVSMLRHYSRGGVGSYDWLPRKKCIRLQVGASRIDARKLCYRYAPCVEIYDLYANIR